MSDDATPPARDANHRTLSLLIDEVAVPGTGKRLDVLDKYSRSPVARERETDTAQVDPMISVADAAFRAGRTSSRERGASLDWAAQIPTTCDDVFGPVLCPIPFDTLDEAIDIVNAAPNGLATGVFTNRLNDAFRAARHLEVGGVHINETSFSPVDLMPYGGTKNSGFGRAGPRYAGEEMTEQRIVKINT
ncbi:NAD-dependent succinate-semialdehyde dehydrogenase [Antarctobacter heliothermus]|uniref:NAD-dependent succinate-semialdehyde dehydrogenase n=1 Tax=Antarctobacter heliothermus TaxID=74033 RepID=A0A222DZY5_9RHOB|nr:aldehyde dehydrogenase family protein [Antarctobacter heliothermus]ASP19462.1 NAD-dependent succinate-semialdehyde dehydrogenase [Antarctobacter heliothermus]